MTTIDVDVTPGSVGTGGRPEPPSASALRASTDPRPGPGAAGGNWLAVLAVLLLASGPAVAQLPPTGGGEPAGTAVAEPAVDPAEPEVTTSLADIPRRYRSFLEFARQVESDLEDDATATGFDEQRRNFLTRVREVLGEDPEAALRAASGNELLDYEVELRNDTLAISRWVGDLDREVRDFEELQERLEEATSSWQELETVARDRSAPDIVVEMTTVALSRIGELESRVAERRDQALLRLSRALAVEERFADLQRAASGHRRELQTDILSLEREPIWDLGPADGRSVLAAFRSQAHRDARSLREYFGAHATLLGLIVLGSILFTIFVWPRLRVPEVEEPGSAAAVVQRILAHPVEGGMVLAILAIIVLAPVAPRPFTELLWFVVPIPAAALGVAALGRDARWILTALAASLCLLALRRYLEIVPLLDRVVLLLQTGGVGGVILWRLRATDWEATLPRRSWRRTARLLGMVSVALMGVAFVAALWGRLGLARYLRDGMLGTLGYTMVMVSACFLLYGVAYSLFAGGPLRHLRVATFQLRRLMAGIGVALVLLSVTVWLILTVNAFQLGARVAAGINAVSRYSLSLGSFELSVGAVLVFLIVVSVSLLLGRVITFFLDEQVLPGLPLSRGVPYAISTTVRYALLLGGFTLAALAAGLDLSQAAFLVGAFTVGIGFGLQNIVNNFVSGLILMYERPVQVGDVVEVGSLLGEVRRIGVRSSTVKTYQGAEVLVPNADLISKEVVNWTLSNRVRRIEIGVGVAYGTDLEQVMALLLGVGQSHEEVTEEPAPAVIFTGFGDSSLDLELRCWVSDVDAGLRVASELRVAIEAALRSAGVEIPFPQRDVHLISSPAAGAPPQGLDATSGAAEGDGQDRKREEASHSSSG